MTAGLGIAVGTANSRTAVVTEAGSATDEPAFVTTSHPSVLYVSPDGSVAFPDASTDPVGTPVAGFVERVGDPVGLLDDAGRVHLGEDLFAAVAAGLRDGAPSTGTVVVTHPTAWNAYTVHALEAALTRAGISTPRVVPEAAACVRWLASSRDLQGDGVAVVYDLGASGLDVTVVRTGGEPSIIGKPIRSEDFGGAHFDHLVTRYVLDTVSDRTGDLDPFDTATTTALADLRRNCAAAKESLSTDTETVIPVALPGYATDVRLVRSELEDLIRPGLVSSLELVREALRSAEIEMSDVGCVLLAGGGGAIPLVAELVSSELGLTVVAAPDPALTAASGAAHLAVDEPTSTAATTVFPEYEHTDDATTTTAVAPVVPSFPSRMRSPRSVSTTRRRIAIVVSAAAAIGVLTAGGLSIGTASRNEPAQSSPSVTGTTTAPTADATTAGSANGGAAPVGTAETVTVARGGTGGAGGAATAVDGGLVRTAGSGRVTTAQGPAPGVPGAAPVAPEGIPAAPAAPAPGGEAPGGVVAPPAYTPPAPAAGAPNPLPPGPSAADVGEGIGNAATGVGAGLGAAVTGIGTGVGNIVGAVVDPVTGLLIGK
ncbi:Hsp70 family protein [Prescottella agglutinans]|uniref:Hsp70 family protein n=1 Tax=Prescottella agglutinans TaxID=1644129 RepID=UPI003D966BF9